MIITLEINERRSTALDRFAADMSVTREHALQAIVDAALADGATEARRRLGIAERRQKSIAIAPTALARALREEKPITAAAKEFGVSYSTVRRRMTNFGLSSKGRAHYPAPRRAEVMRAMREGLETAPTIAAHVGSTRGAVLQVLLALEAKGVAFRKPPRAGAPGRPANRFHLAEAAQ